ncbi:hypothetical protein MKEN_00632500 [Mycena kentingensis (nom. inval.)]|nr:hypothetical protein MKEN_00632500 [Mycena kentingensis (nom. inval.)]
MVKTSPTAERAPRRCTECQKYETEAMKILRCSQCHVTEYCSRECQKRAWKGHKAACNADNSTLTVPEIGRALFTNPTTNRLLQMCFITAFNMLSATREHLLSAPFEAAVDIIIEPVDTADMLKLIIALREEQNGGPRVPAAMFAVCACVQVHKFQRIDDCSDIGFALWKEARDRAEAQSSSAEEIPAIGVVTLTKAHSTGIPETFPVHITASTLEYVREEMQKKTEDAGTWKQLAAMRSARQMLDDSVRVMNLFIKTDARMGGMLLGMRTTLSIRDIQVLREYAAGKDLERGQPGMHLEPFKRRYYAASLLRERYEAENEQCQEDDGR